jgi:hypothetical protein
MSETQQGDNHMIHDLQLDALKLSDISRRNDISCKGRVYHISCDDNRMQCQGNTKESFQ